MNSFKHVEKIMKRFTSIIALLLMVMGNAFAQKGTFDKIMPELLEEINGSRKSDDTYRIIIIMNEQLDSQKLTRHAQNLSKTQQREYIFNELRSTSERSQKEVLKDLQQGQKAALVDDIKSFWIINGISCSTTKEMVHAIAERPDVKYIMKDLEIHIADGEESEDIQLARDGNEWNVTKVNADDVWELGYTGSGIIVAVIDSGVNYNHTDIANNMWDGGSEYPHHGYDFVNNDNDPKDDHGHGTHCAGTVSSYGTNGRQCGIAKDAKIMALKVLEEDGSGFTSSCYSAIEFAVSHNADVLSMSLGSRGTGGIWVERIVMENVLSCGIIASVSAGNVGSTYSQGLLLYPIPYNVGAPGNCPSPWRHPDQTLAGGRAAVVTVGNTMSSDDISLTSSIGPSTWAKGEYIGFYDDYCWAENNPDSIGLIKPDISAPGNKIYSLTHYSDTDYTVKSGTSMAAPCVAGVMALMLSVNPTLTPLEIDSIIETTAVPCGGQTTKNNYYGAGRIDALAAINYMLNACAAPSNLNATVNRANVTLNWDAASDVSSYRVYRNGIMIASSVSETHYTDESVPAGNNTYFVRSNGDNHQTSIPSNQVTVSILTNTEAYAPTELTATEINTESSSVSLSWNAESRTENLYYTNSIAGYSNFESDSGMIMAQKFPSSMLQRYGGMQVEHVYFSVYNPEASCTISLYEGDKMQTGILRHSGSITSTDAQQSIDYEVNPPVVINPDKDLWLTITTYDSLAYSNYPESNTNDAFLYRHPSVNYWSSVHGYAWSFQLGLNDGEHTYNVYRNGNNISSSQTDTILTDTYTEGMNEYLITSVTNGYESLESNRIILVNNTAAIEGLSLNDDDKLYVLPNSTLTVDSLTNDNPDNLILENGAQLIHNNGNVKATVKKAIAAHGNNPNTCWNFIASPLTEGSNNVLTDSYDLYYYDENAHFWRNHKSHQDDFSFDNGIGYLYANAENVTLSFAGTLNASTTDPTIPVTASAEQLKGFNLVGNPFAHNLNISNLAIDTTGGFSAISTIYELSGNNVVINQNPSTIAPCTGFFIKATKSGTLHFNHDWTEPDHTHIRDLKIEVNTASRDASLLDRAYINFDGNDNLEKLILNDNSTRIYIPQGDAEYAIATIQDQDEMPLNFKAEENGTYTLNIEAENLDLDYLHLVDNLTGNNIDLLTTPCYTFEAKTSDYASRFRLLFAPICEDANADNDNFAYLCDGNIVVNMEDKASLQILDMTEHVIIEGDTINRIPTSGMAKGMYVLRLITANGVKTQKIVIE